MWIESFIHKEKKGIIDISALTLSRGLSYGTFDKDRVLIKGAVGERTVLYDRLFPGMAIDLRQDEDTAEIRLNFPAGSYDIGLFFDLIGDVCRLGETGTFYIEANEISTEEINDLKDYFTEISTEILKILTGQLEEKKVTGLIIIGSLNPYVIGLPQAQKIDNDIDNYALTISRAQRTKAVYGTHWSYIGGYRNICVYEASRTEKTILPLYPVPYLGSNMPRRCEYYVDVPGVTFFKYDEFMREFRDKAERYDGASIIISPSEYHFDDMKHRFGIDLWSGDHSHMMSYGRFIDWGEYHYGKVRRKHLNTDELSCYSHIAIYLEWCYRHHLLSRSFMRDYPDIEYVIKGDDIDLREYLRNHVANGGALGPLTFNDKGRDFTRRYYLFGKDGFAADVDRTALEILGKEAYESAEYKNEAYLFMKYDDTYRNALFRKIDKAWNRYESGKLDDDPVSLAERRMF